MFLVSAHLTPPAPGSATSVPISSAPSIGWPPLPSSHNLSREETDEVFEGFHVGEGPAVCLELFLRSFPGLLQVHPSLLTLRPLGAQGSVGGVDVEERPQKKHVTGGTSWMVVVSLV